eukprot:2748225-Pyramimonas_sp.AAC.1
MTEGSFVKESLLMNPTSSTRTGKSPSKKESLLTSSLPEGARRVWIEFECTEFLLKGPLLRNPYQGDLC